MYRLDPESKRMRLIPISNSGGTVESSRVPIENDQTEAPISNNGEILSLSPVATENANNQVPISNNRTATFGTEIEVQSKDGGRFTPRVHKRRRTLGDGEDRLSMLPNDLIHHIFSFINTKFAVQTSVLSTRWKNVWKFLPFLNLSAVYFDDLSDFSRFVINVISYRDHDSDVSTLNLYFTAREDLLLINTVIGYAVAHNCRQLLTNRYFQEIGRRIRHSFFFDCQSLERLSLSRVSNSTLSAWKLPALTSLFLEDASLTSWYRGAPDEGLFSGFLNLKNLTLINCYFRSKSLKHLVMSSRSLETLKIKNSRCMFKAEACTVELSMDNLASFQYEGYSALCFSMNDSNRLEVVKMDLSVHLAHMLYQFRSVKYFTFSISSFRVLPAVLDMLKSRPYPFPHLKHLRIENEQLDMGAEAAAVYADVMTYFRGFSPAAVVECRNGGSNDFPDNAFVRDEEREWAVRCQNERR